MAVTLRSIIQWSEICIQCTYVCGEYEIHYVGLMQARQASQVRQASFYCGDIQMYMYMYNKCNINEIHIRWSIVGDMLNSNHILNSGVAIDYTVVGKPMIVV